MRGRPKWTRRPCADCRPGAPSTPVCVRFAHLVSANGCVCVCVGEWCVFVSCDGLVYSCLSQDDLLDSKLKSSLISSEFIRRTHLLFTKLQLFSSSIPGFCTKRQVRGQNWSSSTSISSRRCLKLRQKNKSWWPNTWPKRGSWRRPCYSWTNWRERDRERWRNTR